MQWRRRRRSPYFELHIHMHKNGDFRLNQVRPFDLPASIRAIKQSLSTSECMLSDHLVPAQRWWWRLAQVVRVSHQSNHMQRWKITHDQWGLMAYIFYPQYSMSFGSKMYRDLQWNGYLFSKRTQKLKIEPFSFSPLPTWCSNCDKACVL